MSTQIWVINVDLTGVFGEASCIGVEAVCVPWMVQAHILCTHNLCQQIVVWVVVQRCYLHVTHCSNHPLCDVLQFPGSEAYILVHKAYAGWRLFARTPVITAELLAKPGCDAWT